MFRELPVEYNQPIEESGKLEIFQYEYLGKKKECMVYLPYDYSDEKSYRVVYLMHGGGADIYRFFGGLEATRPLKNTLDHMIVHKDIEPMIIVCPTYFGIHEGKDEALVKVFNEELINALIPSLEGHYSTYYRKGLSISESRKYRAFGGYSMGAVTTYWIFTQCLDYIQYYLPMSGECWIKGQLGGGKYPQETAQALAEYVEKKHQSFKMIQCVGDAGIAYPNVEPQIQAMYTYPEAFNQDNLKYIVAPGLKHDSLYANIYLYNALPDLFD